MSIAEPELEGNPLRGRATSGPIEGPRLEFVQQRFHFGESVSFAGLGGARDALVQDFARLFRPRVLYEHLREHKISGDIIRVALEQLAESGLSPHGRPRIS